MGYIHALTTVASRATRSFNDPIVKTVVGIFQGNHAKFSARSYTPTRYGDPHENAAKILQDRKLDRYAFPTWQDLANFYGKNDDPRGIALTISYARQDGEKVFAPRFKADVRQFDVDGRENLTNADMSNLTRSREMLRVAGRCVEDKKLDGEHFKTWDGLKDYLERIDEWRLLGDVNRCQSCRDVPPSVSIADGATVDVWDARFTRSKPNYPDQNGMTVELEEILAEEAQANPSNPSLAIEWAELEEYFADHVSHKYGMTPKFDYDKDNWLSACVDCHDQLHGVVHYDKEKWISSFTKSFPQADPQAAEKAWRLSIERKNLD